MTKGNGRFHHVTKPLTVRVNPVTIPPGTAMLPAHAFADLLKIASEGYKMRDPHVVVAVTGSTLETFLNGIVTHPEAAVRAWAIEELRKLREKMAEGEKATTESTENPEKGDGPESQNQDEDHVSQGPE